MKVASHAPGGRRLEKTEISLKKRCKREKTEYHGPKIDFSHKEVESMITEKGFKKNPKFPTFFIE